DRDLGDRARMGHVGVARAGAVRVEIVRHVDWGVEDQAHAARLALDLEAVELVENLVRAGWRPAGSLDARGCEPAAEEAPEAGRAPATHGEHRDAVRVVEAVAHGAAVAAHARTGTRGAAVAVKSHDLRDARAGHEEAVIAGLRRLRWSRDHQRAGRRQ